MAYELLTGALPFAGQTTSEILAAKERMEPVPASTRSPLLGAATDAVLASGLSRDPALRWQSCAQMAQALEQAIADDGYRRQTYAEAEPYAQPHADAHTDGHSDGHADPDADPHPDAHGHADRDRHPDAQPGSPVRQVSLLRHAKSSWAADGQPDRDRPLAPRGRKAARRLAVHLREQEVRPDLVLCSPAARTRETLELIRVELGDDVDVQVEEELYGAGARELLDRLRRLPDAVEWAMVVGHNPGLQQLVVLLARDGALRERARSHYPTGALATLRLPQGGWTELAPGRAELREYVAPRELV